MFLIFTMKQSGAQGRNVRHESATRSNESHGTEMQGTAYQSNADCPLETAGFPSRFGSGAAHRKASQCIADHCKAHQSNADCPLATVGFPSRFGSKATQGRVSQCSVWHRRVAQGIAKTCIAWRCNARHITAHQSNAHRGLATDLSAGRFGLLGGFSSALLLT